jgi:hypothetical protein
VSFVLKALMGAQADPAAFVVSRITDSAGAPTLSLAGAAVGDFAVVYANNGPTGAVTPPAGWTTETYTGGTTGGAVYYTSIFTKILTQVDITAGTAAFSGGTTDLALILTVYRGPVTYTSKSPAYVNNGSSSLVLAGFTPSPISAGAVTFVTNRGANTPAVPSGFTSRASATAGTFKARVADAVPTGYSGGSVTWTNIFGDATFPTYGWLIELL